jgi:recombination protein RecA
LRTELLDCIPGLQVDKLTIIKSSEDKFLTAEDYLNIIDYIVSEEKGCLIIIDSVASLMPESKAAVKFGESSRMTATPTLLYEFFRKCIAKINVFNSNIIGISHMQANVGGYGGPVEVGGNALKFYASIKMMCLSSPEIPADDPNKTGRISKFKIPKSAITKPTEGSFYIEYGKGYDYIQDLVENAIQLSLIEKTGAWYTIQSGKYKDTKIQGMEKVMNIVREDTNLAKELDATIRSMILGTK